MKQGLSQKNGINQGELPLVSIVITTKNEERNIENCLISIKEQTYYHIEIIVVDNASEDKTKEIALKYTDKVYDKGPERSMQRNYGMIEIARGEYVMFVDADMILSPCLIDACVNELNKGESVALFISEIILAV
jgi:glycosyltransferase involved in cell wall biosynthesis